jgi:hypothetical protein
MMAPFLSRDQSTQHTSRCSTTSAIGVFVRKHRSAEPGIGTAALGSNSRPASWRLIFCQPNAKAWWPSPKTTASIPSTRS